MITEKDLKYLKVAKAVSNLSNYPRIKIGACVVKNNNIIGTGYNQEKSHPIQAKYNKSTRYETAKSFLHAEIDALIKSGGESKGAAIYVFRKRKDGVTGNCMPCAACRKYIIDNRIKRIVWTTESGVFEEKLY